MLTIRPKVFWTILVVWGLFTWCIVATALDRVWWHEKYNIDAEEELYSAYRQVLPTSEALGWSESSELYKSLETFVSNSDPNKRCFRGDLQRSEYKKLAAARGIEFRDLPPMRWDDGAIPNWMIVSVILSLACGYLYLCVSSAIWAYWYFKKTVPDERYILRRVLIGVSIGGILAFYPLVIAWLACLAYLIYAFLKRRHSEMTGWLMRIVAVGGVLAVIVCQAAIQSNSRIKLYEAGKEKRQLLRDLDWDVRSRTVNQLIHLSNRMYTVYSVETNPAFAQAKTKQLIEYEYLNKQVAQIIAELKKLPKNDAGRKIVDPAVDICNGIVTFIKLYTPHDDAPRIEMNQAKAIAEFRVVLDKLRDYTEGELKPTSLSLYPCELGLLWPDTIKQFDPTAAEEYKRIQGDTGEKEYNIFLIFGYVVYDYVDKNSAKAGDWSRL